MVDLDIVIMEDEEVGGYISIVPSLPGCHTQGDTIEEVIKNTKEAILLYIETLSKEEKMDLLKKVPRFMGIQKIEISA
jgi:predicted RNase H-like HicB family nuclease